MTLAMSLAKNSREASATPWIANEPRWPSDTSFRYSWRIWSLLSRVSSTTDMNHSVIFRFGVFSGVRKVFLTSCWVMVLPLAR